MDFSFVVGLILAFFGFVFAKAIYSSDAKKFADKNRNCTLDGIGIVRGVESKEEWKVTEVNSRKFTVWKYDMDIRDISGRWHRIPTDWNPWYLGSENTKVSLKYNAANIAEFAIKNDKLFGGISAVMFGIFLVVGIFGIYIAVRLFLLNF